MRTCDCSYCIGGRQKAYDLVCVDDFYEEVDYAPRKKKKSNPFPKKKNDCDHIWVWTSEFVGLGWDGVDFYKIFGYHKFIEKRCVGCDEVAKTAVTERYRKRYDRWVRARRDSGKRAWTSFYYGGWEREHPLYRAAADKIQAKRDHYRQRDEDFLILFKARNGL